MNIPNFPIYDDKYEYTDDDYIKAIQPNWIGTMLECENNTQRTFDEYEYTDEDFIKAIQPFYTCLESKCGQNEPEENGYKHKKRYQIEKRQSEIYDGDDGDNNDDYWAWQYTSKPQWMDGVQMFDIGFDTPSVDNWDDEENSPEYYG